ncbi:MAG: MBL fold metallo-hydrolase [Anaerolineales bacterium]|nr:MBL fold metallo-hydrolase [Anaerolineales bacterium]MCB9129130.1 MBL fold metallo-hydrolase [Ardenticatenales bacterium]
MKQVAKNVYYQPTFRGVNLGVVATDEGVVLVDAPMLPMVARAWQEEVEDLGKIEFILNTDHLQEHTMGNYYLPGDIIAHHETRGRMRMTDRAKESYIKFVIENDESGAAEAVANYELRYPNIELFDHLTIHMGGCELSFLALPGHTMNNVGLYLPESKLLFCGDTVMNNYRPYLGLATFDTWLETLQMIDEMEIELLVPGHGEPVGKAAIQRMSLYIAEMYESVADLIAEGRTRDEVVSRMMPRFEDWPINSQRRDEERNLFRQGIRQLYDTITGRR